MANLRANVTSQNLCKSKKYQRLFHSLGMFGVLSSFRISFFMLAGQIVGRAADPFAASVQDMSIHHHRLNFTAANQLTPGSEILCVCYLPDPDRLIDRCRRIRLKPARRETGRWTTSVCPAETNKIADFKSAKAMGARRRGITLGEPFQAILVRLSQIGPDRRDHPPGRCEAWNSGFRPGGKYRVGYFAQRRRKP